MIENPNDLGRYESCDQLVKDLSFSISDGCHYSRMFINFGGHDCQLNSITVGLGLLNRQNIQNFLENQDEKTTSEVFKEAANNRKIIESKRSYFIVLDPTKDTIQALDIDGNYIPTPNERFLAFAKPSVAVDCDGKAEIKWVIDDIRNADLSGKGAILLNHFQTQVPEVKLKSRAFATE